MTNEEFLRTTYKDGDIIVKEGTKSREMYIIQAGKVKVVKGSGNEEIELGVLHEGDIFGEMGLLDTKPRSATVKAVGKAKVLAIDRGVLLKRIEEDPAFALVIMRNMGQKIRGTNTLLSAALEMLKTVQDSKSLQSRTEALEEKGLLGKTYKDGDIIVKEGTKSREMYIIQAGKVKVVKDRGNEEIELGVLHEGDVFGEMSLLDTKPRSATVKAVGKAKVLAIDREVFLKRVEEDPAFALVIMRDMGTNTLLSTALEISRVVENSPSSVMITNSKGNVEYVNPKFTQLTGYPREEVLGKNLRILKFSKTPPEEYKRLWEIITSGGEWHGEVDNKKKNGEHYWESISISSVKNLAGAITHFIVIQEDITERKRAEEIIQQMAYYDTLTALANRALFNDRLTMELARAHRNKHMLAVLFLDLDGFKDINDTLGHTGGDELLKVIAERLKNGVREEDTVARMGGDEFTLILPKIVHVEDATRVAQKILDTIKQPLKLNGHEFSITTSIGIALYPKDGEDRETLLKSADIAMYRAKGKGRNNHQFYSPV
ncbi:MAG: diguanylate cyclase domain-containing protein [Candidatus Brocadiales bacterium]